MSFSFLGLEELIDDADFIFCRGVIGPSCQLGINRVGVLELAWGDRWEHSCNLNGLQDADGSTMPKPMREDMSEVWVVNCLTPCL